MSFMDLFKDIMLVITGGVVTYLTTMAVNRVQARKPSISWRLLPAVSFPSESITSFSISLENDGNKDAENVRIAAIFPKDTKIESFEVQVSEKATGYEILKSEREDEIVVTFPLFYKNLECIFAFLARDLDPNDIQVSIVGGDVIGKKKLTETSKKEQRVKRYSRFTMSFLSFVIVIYSLILAYMLISGIAQANYAQQLDIAELYIETGHPELAINALEEVSHFWWVPTSTRLDYTLASVYVIKGEAGPAKYYIERAAKIRRVILK